VPAQNCNITPPLKKSLSSNVQKYPYKITNLLLLFCQLPLPIIKSQRISKIKTIKITIITRIVFSIATITRVPVVYIRLKIIYIVVIVANCCNCNLFTRNYKLKWIKRTILYLIALITTSYAFASLSVLIAKGKGGRSSTLRRGKTRCYTGSARRSNRANLNCINLDLVKVYSIRLIV
jgi:hypothetical protein